MRRTALTARDVPYSSEGAEEDLLDMRLVVVGFPTVEADTVRLCLDRWTLRGRRKRVRPTCEEEGTALSPVDHDSHSLER